MTAFSLTRIAPTPSGFLHLGNALSFLITAALAKRTGARTLLRIDDLDKERTDKKYVRDIFDTLHFLGIPWEEGPRDYDEYKKDFSQVHRMPLYEAALQQLKDGGKVFACECSRREIERVDPSGAYPGTCRDKNIRLDRPGVSWRLNTGEYLPPSVKDFVIRKKNGFPSYQVTSVVDDQHYGVDLVVRGLDLLPSTRAQLYLSSLLAGNPFGTVHFVHHPLILESPDKKLSKSAGAASIQFLRKDGATAADIISLIEKETGPVINFSYPILPATYTADPAGY
ncbi:MAG TPA: glutamate--tRNA ligase family protein [Puia sp.]|nr:glutamate--tRNA ligase family protein [Puia sp.]